VRPAACDLNSFLLITGFSEVVGNASSYSSPLCGYRFRSVQFHARIILFTYGMALVRPLCHVRVCHPSTFELYV
jgi:hypothetical protein